MRTSRTVPSAQALAYAGVLVAAFGVPVAFTPGVGSGFGPAKAALLAISVLAILVASALDGSLARDAWLMLRSSRTIQAGTALVVLALISTVFSVDVRAALAGSYPDYRGFLALVAFSLVGLAAAVLSARERTGGPEFARLVLRASAIALLLLAAIALAEKAGLPPATMKLEGAVRTISTAGNASNLGVVCCLLLPLTLGASLLDPSARWRAAARVAALGGVVTVVWTLSRGAWLGLLVALALVIAYAVFAARRESVASGKGSRAPSTSERSLALMAGLLGAALVVGVVTMPQSLPRAARLLETGSTTATWRLQTWRGTLVMIGDRALTGVGPNGFRAAFLDYKRPGADDGRLGYLPTESSHNAVLDTAASFGIGGFFALAAIAGTAGIALVTRLRSDDPAPALVLAASLSAASVALLFHYVTLDTGPLFALVLGILAAWPPTPRLDGAMALSTGRLRAAAYSVAITWALVTIAALGLVAADGLSGSAARRAASGESWELTARAATTLAPWEPAVHRAAGRAAALSLRSAGAGGSEAGASAYARALKLSPKDPAMLLEAGRFELALAAAERDDERVAAAASLFERAARMDPASGVPLAELGRVALARRDPASALDLLERAVQLSPGSTQAWTDLAEARRMTGDSAGAQAAARTAAVLGD